MNIYTNNGLKYPLTNKECNDINSVWQFIGIFAKPFVSVTDYRNYLLETIKNYSVDEIYYLENIANKLFWNLRWTTFIFVIDDNISLIEYDKFLENYGDYQSIPKDLMQYNETQYDDLNQKLKEIELDNFYRSFINKLIMIDPSAKTIYYKNMEGSADIFNKNKFNLFTMTVLLNRELYEKVMVNPYNYRNSDIELSHYYYQYDYGFPNLNCCVYDFGNIDNKKYRIRKMYLEDGANNWFKIIKYK